MHTLLMLGAIFLILALSTTSRGLFLAFSMLLVVWVVMTIHEHRYARPELIGSFMDGKEIICKGGGGMYSRPTNYIVKKSAGWQIRGDTFVNEEKGLVFEIDSSVCEVQ